MVPNQRRKATAVVSLIIASIVITSCVPSAGFDPDIGTQVLALASGDPVPSSVRIDTLKRTDSIAAYYANPFHSRKVIDFFADLTRSEKIAKAILDNSVKYNVPVSLAFGLAYEESEFNPRAVNVNSDSTDRGLFQLNSKAFPEVDAKTVFDPDINAEAGLRHFGKNLSTAGNEVAALAIYNAGHGRVTKVGTPRSTLDYISRVQKYSENVTNLFTARVVAREPLLDRVRFGLLSGAAEGRLGRP